MKNHSFCAPTPPSGLCLECERERLEAENVRLRAEWADMDRQRKELIHEKSQTSLQIRDYRNIVELAVDDLTVAVELGVTSDRVKSTIRILKEALALKRNHVPEA